MDTKKFKIIIDEGSAENSTVFVSVNSEKLTSGSFKDDVISEALTQHLIQTKDVRWINDIKELT